MYPCKRQPPVVCCSQLPRVQQGGEYLQLFPSLCLVTSCQQLTLANVKVFTPQKLAKARVYFLFQFFWSYHSILNNGSSVSEGIGPGKRVTSQLRLFSITLGFQRLSCLLLLLLFSFCSTFVVRPGFQVQMLYGDIQ